jgi:HemY protein
MRYTLWLYLVFAGAVAAALIMGSNGATVAVFWSPYRVDLSLNLALLIVLTVFVVGHLTWRSISVLLHLPTEAKQWRLAQKERAMHHALLMAHSHLSAGRFTRGKKAAEQAISLSTELSHASKKSSDSLLVGAVGHLVAARCCHQLNDSVSRDAHLAAMQIAVKAQGGGQLKDAAILQAAQWALDEQDASNAFTLLGQLSPGTTRRTFALKLRLRASQQSGQVRQALETAQLLTKHRAFSSDASVALLRGLAIQSLLQAHDVEQLSAAWLRLGDSHRAQLEVAAQAVVRLAQLGGDARLARDWLLVPWDTVMKQLAAGAPVLQTVPTLVEALSPHLTGLDPEWLARIEKAHRQFPNQPSLQYLAGLACYACGLWGKAESLLLGAVPGLDEGNLARSAWRLLAMLAERKGQDEEAKAYFKKAAMVGSGLATRSAQTLM